MAWGDYGAARLECDAVAGRIGRVIVLSSMQLSLEGCHCTVKRHHDSNCWLFIYTLFIACLCPLMYGRFLVHAYLANDYVASASCEAAAELTELADNCANLHHQSVLCSSS